MIFIVDMHIKFLEFTKRFGKTFFAKIFRHAVVVTSDARYIEHILSSSVHTEKNIVYLLLSKWLGNGLLLSHGSPWQIMRKIITPTFHFKILEQFVDIFDRQSDVLVQKLESMANGEEYVNIYSHMGLLTLDIIAGILNYIKKSYISSLLLLIIY